MGWSDLHFSRILEANPHFPRIFEILTFLLFQYPHFPRFFYPHKS